MTKKEFYLDIENWVKNQISDSKGPLMIGLNAPQGAGKTTLSNHLVNSMTEQGYKIACVSIDDFYLTNSEQTMLATKSKNPFLQQRGYPGTHDLELGEKTLSLLSKGKDVKIPRYDKSCFSGQGDRKPEKDWLVINQPQDIVILEGWMLGFAPKSELSSEHLNEINHRLKGYQAWHKHLSAFIYLEPTSSELVVDWRVEAEKKMRATGVDGMSDKDALGYINKFLPAYRTYSSTVKLIEEQVSSYLNIVIGKDRLPTQ